MTYQSTVITFWVAREEVHASVYYRTYPDGRQRRFEVAKYTLGPASELVTPRALLTALMSRIEEAPDYLVK